MRAINDSYERAKYTVLSEIYVRVDGAVNTGFETTQGNELGFVIIPKRQLIGY